MELRHDLVRERAFEISQAGGAGSPLENWLRAERELAAVLSEYDTVDRDLERHGMKLARVPGEAGVMWRLELPRGECVEEWEPGNAGLRPPAAVAQLVDAVVAGRRLVPSPPASADPGAVRLRRLLEEQREALLRHDPGVRVGGDPENLRRHRVAARRARAFLRATRSALDPAWRQSLDERLRELGRATGPVRDLDVVVEHVSGQLRADATGNAREANGLVAALETLGEAARLRLLEALDGQAYRRILGELRGPVRLAGDGASIAVSQLAHKEVERLAERVDRLGKELDESELHGLRIDLKRARYAAELATDEGEERARFLADAKALEDLLGERHDALAAEALLREATVHDDATAVAFLGGRLAERQVGRRERMRERLPEAWRRLRESARRLGAER